MTTQDESIQDFFIPTDRDLFTEEDIQNAVNEIQAEQDKEWLALVGGMFYRPPQRTTNNRKKKRRRK
jgi:hypothetical protein